MSSIWRVVGGDDHGHGSGRGAASRELLALPARRNGPKSNPTRHVPMRDHLQLRGTVAVYGSYLRIDRDLRLYKERNKQKASTDLSPRLVYQAPVSAVYVHSFPRQRKPTYQSRTSRGSVAGHCLDWQDGGAVGRASELREEGKLEENTGRCAKVNRSSHECSRGHHFR